MSNEKSSISDKRQLPSELPVPEIADFEEESQKEGAENMESSAIEVPIGSEYPEGDDIDQGVTDNEFMKSYQEEVEGQEENNAENENFGYGYEEYEEENQDENPDEYENDMEPPPVDLTCLSNFDPGSQESIIEEIDHQSRGSLEPLPVELLGSTSPPTEPKDLSDPNKEPVTEGDVVLNTDTSGRPCKKPKRGLHCAFQHTLSKDNRILNPLDVKKKQRNEGWKCLVGYFNSILNPRHYCPYMSATNIEYVNTPQTEKKIGPLTLAERRAKIQKYIEKRKRRLWNRKVMYTIRKANASKKLRVGGRFAAKGKLRPIKPEDVEGAENIVYKKELPVIEQPIFCLRKVLYKRFPASHRPHHIPF